MRAAILLFALFLPVAAQQTEPRSLGSAIFYAQMDPASPGAIGGWNSARFREGKNTLIRAWVYSATRAVYWGCEVLLEPTGDDKAYFASFHPLTLTGTDITSNVRSPRLGDPSRWKLEPPPTYPLPQRVEVGETLAIDLMVNRVTGERLTGYLEIDDDAPNSGVRAELRTMSTPELREFEKQVHERLRASDDAVAAAFRRQVAAVPQAVGSPAPPVEGVPRDFSVQDAGMQISAPRIYVNGIAQNMNSPASASGPVLWFYLPGRGRFIVSLAPRPGFMPGGAVGKNLIEVRDGKDAIVVESAAPVVDRDSTYSIYVRSEKEWKPEPAQGAGFQFGSLSTADLALSAAR